MSESAKRKADDTPAQPAKKSRTSTLQADDFALYFSEQNGNAIIHIIGGLCDGKYPALILQQEGDIYSGPENRAWG